tara:strand:+ start:2793 stop:3932 length:1140 start_codon:yes stop_codon:yes gene_type:complete
MKQIKEIPFYYYLLLLATTAIAVGVEWDISWHSSIGRDKLLSPPHVVVYIGGIICGLICSFIVFQQTFFIKKNKGVQFWGFKAPLACWICIWGMIAMLTSAPFDDWWHNAYGLDVQIISPPHIVLAVGIFSVILGSCLLILAQKNNHPEKNIYEILYLYAASLILIQLSIVLTEYSFANKQHSYEFYKFSSIVYGFLIIAFKFPSRYKYSATFIAIFYMIHRMLVIWILPLFQAEPMLAPIYRDVDYFVAPYFPVILVIPALIVDILHEKIKSLYTIYKSIIMSICICASIFITQWYFSIFLLSDYAENWFFRSGQNIPYFIPIGPWEGKFFEFDFTPYGRKIALGIMSPLNFLYICLYTSISIYIAFGFSNWLKHIKR